MSIGGWAVAGRATVRRLLSLFVQAIPGAIAGAAGGWWKERRVHRGAVPAPSR